MLEHPVTVIPGIGKSRAKLAAKLDLETVRDVLFSFPRTYKDYTHIFSPDKAEIGMEKLFAGELIDLREKKLQGKRRLIQARLLGKRRALTLSWFTFSYHRGYSYQYNQLQNKHRLWVYGQVKSGLYGPEIVGGEFYAAEPKHLGLFPVYPLVSGITHQMRLNWIEFALQHLNEIEECLPPDLIDKFIDRKQAINSIHFPINHEELTQARRRLIFEEFFLFHISLGLIKRKGNYAVHKPDGKITKAFLANLPFKLTNGQKQAINIVREDMESDQQMRRLIQGDVGSGKTVVAKYASLKAVDSHGQVAIMVPTEVLAKQMYARIYRDFKPLGVTTALLVGNTRIKQQEEILKGLANGDISIAVGTHALISEKVEFANLTLAIVDEQHRFGVRQRIALSDKGKADLIVMSATPIPRSLALSLYGDLDTTLIQDKPPGRKKIDTRLIHPKQRDDVYRFLVSRVNQGEQGFVVFPLVEESEKMPVRAAISEMENLSQNQLAHVRVGLVHGQMGKERDRSMEDFYNGKIDVLISTTVIEVGMNVPNATVMIIENADRFGLAQLHQLRGRVGRSIEKAYCFLIANPQTDLAKQRLNVLRTTNDGLKIAEEDLKLRGPGDLLGTRQSGEPWFRLADIIRDQNLLELASEEARKIIIADPELKQYPILAVEVNKATAFN